jgi:methyl-accepting chemotaxis protein
MKKRSSLERQMLTYFGLIAAASLLITVEFIWAIQTTISGAEAVAPASAAGNTSRHVIVTSLSVLRSKAVLMGIVQAVVTFIVLVMFIKRITGPLQEMVEHSRAICEGDLSRTIRIRRQDEIGLIGETVNGLTSNLQEIVAFGLSTESALRHGLEELRTRVGQDLVCREQLNAIEERLADFRDILEGFKLFPAPPAKTEERKK